MRIDRHRVNVLIVVRVYCLNGFVLEIPSSYSLLTDGFFHILLTFPIK